MVSIEWPAARKFHHRRTVEDLYTVEVGQGCAKISGCEPLSSNHGTKLWLYTEHLWMESIPYMFSRRFALDPNARYL
jgi:hypothetical protein